MDDRDLLTAIAEGLRDSGFAAWIKDEIGDPGNGLVLYTSLCILIEHGNQSVAIRFRKDPTSYRLWCDVPFKAIDLQHPRGIDLLLEWLRTLPNVIKFFV